MSRYIISVTLSSNAVFIGVQDGETKGKICSESHRILRNRIIDNNIEQAIISACRKYQCFDLKTNSDLIEKHIQDNIFKFYGASNE